MSGADKRASGAAPAKNPPGSDDSDAPAYVVARGRTVSVGGKSVGPGKPVDVPAEDAEWLLARGFIVVSEADEGVAGGVTVGALKITGGRKPGGVVR